jgi:hypothetical protein
LETAVKEIEPEELGLVGRGLHFLSVMGLCVALGTYLFKLWSERILPSQSTDSLIYHLTIPAQWTQRGFLQTVDLPFHDGAAEHSPLFTEVLIYGLMKLTGNDDLAFLIQPVFFLLMVGLFHRSVRLLGLNVVIARFLAAFVLLFSPFFHSSLFVNSEMVMTCGVAAFGFGMLLTRESTSPRREAGWYVAAAGIALTLAAKTVGIIYGSLAVVILVGSLAAERSADSAAGGRSKIRIGAICAAIILCGLAFHIRNLWEHGNPFYPAELRVLGLRILPGRYNASVFINHGWSWAALSKMLYSDPEGEQFAMYTQYGIVLWPAMLVPLALLVLRKLKGADALPTVLFVFYPLASIAVYFAVVPFWSEHRLLFPVYYLLWGGLGWSLRLLTRGQSELVQNLVAGVVALAYVASTLFFFFVIDHEVPLGIPIVAGLVGLVLANYPRVLQRNWRLPWVVPAAVTAGLLISAPWWYRELSRQRERNRASTYSQYYGPQGEAWNRLDELTKGKPATIAYSGNALTYPLFGSRLTNRVVYLPIHPQDQPGPVTLTKGNSIYLQLSRQRRREADEKYWLEQLREQEVEYLLLVSDPQFDGVEIERRFAAHNPQLLKLKFEQKGVWIYEVQRSVDPSGGLLPAGRGDEGSNRTFAVAGSPLGLRQLGPAPGEPVFAENREGDAVFQIGTEDGEQRQRQEPGEVHSTAVAVPFPELHGDHDRGRTAQQGAEIFLSRPDCQTAPQGHARGDHRQPVDRVPAVGAGPDSCEPADLGHPEAEHRLHQGHELRGVPLGDKGERSHHRADRDEEPRQKSHHSPLPIKAEPERQQEKWIVKGAHGQANQESRHRRAAIENDSPQQQGGRQHMPGVAGHLRGVGENEIERGRADSHLDVLEVPVANENHGRQNGQMGEDGHRLGHRHQGRGRMAVQSVGERRIFRSLHGGIGGVGGSNHAGQEMQHEVSRPMLTVSREPFLLGPGFRSDDRLGPLSAAHVLGRDLAGDDIGHQEDKQAHGQKQQAAGAQVWLEQWAADHGRIEEEPNQH